MEGNLRADNPLVSFPQNALADASIRTDYGVVEVREAAVPIQLGYKAVAGDPAGDPLTEVWNLVVKEVGELEPHEITRVEMNPPEAHNAGEGTPEFVAGDPYGHWKSTWVYTAMSGYEESRMSAYGSPGEQIEFITENSLKDWKDKVDAIKLKYPKP